MTEPATGEDRRQQRHERWRGIITSVFGLILALGAFALTDVRVATPSDVLHLIETYLPIFGFVLVAWNGVSELFDIYPARDDMFLPSILAITFLSTMFPVFVKLAALGQGAVVHLALFLTPGDLLGLFIVFLVLNVRLLRRYRSELDAEDRRDTLRHVISGSIGSAMVAISLLIPLLPLGIESPPLALWLGTVVIPVIVQLIGPR